MYRMKYLQIVKQMEASEAVQPDHASPLCDEIDEKDEQSTAIREDDSSISSNSLRSDEFPTDESAAAAVADNHSTGGDTPFEIAPVERRTNWYESAAAEAAVAALRFWYGVGALNTLPERVPGFTGGLAHYSDRARLIGMVKAILDSVPWSLTAQDRAVQFVTVLTPLIERGGA